MRLRKDNLKFENWMKISANYNFDTTFVCRCFRVNIAVNKHYNQATWGRKGLLNGLNTLNHSLLREPRQKLIPGGSLATGADAEATKGAATWLVLPAFL